MPNPILEIVKDCENYLGWLPDGNPFRSRAVAAVRLERAAAKTGATPEDLRLALAYCRRTKTGLKHPSSLVGYVDRAKQLARVEPEISDVGARIELAIRWEMERDLPDSTRWIDRLSRASGQIGKALVLTEWESARGR